MLFQRDTRQAQTFKPASTLSSVSEASVHYLNDQSAINVACQQPAQQPTTSKVDDLPCSSSTIPSQQDAGGVPGQGSVHHPQPEMLQSTAHSPSASQRLESLRRQQADDKVGVFTSLPYQLEEIATSVCMLCCGKPRCPPACLWFCSMIQTPVLPCAFGLILTHVCVLDICICMFSVNCTLESVQTQFESTVLTCVP